MSTLWRRRLPGTVMRMLVLALVLAACFGLVELLDWQQFTAVLSGTFLTQNHTADQARCFCYLLGYFAFVVVCPILLLGAGVSGLLERLLLRRPRSDGQTAMTSCCR